MPYLDLPSLDRPDAQLYIWSVMLAPHDESVRDQIRETFDAKCVRNVLPELDVITRTAPVDVVRRCFDMVAGALRAPQEQDLRRQLEAGAKDGGFAGNTFTYIMLAAKDGSDEHATLGAAFRAYVSVNDRRSSGTTLKRMWSKGMPVAHLWAAMATFRGLFEKPSASLLAQWLEKAEQMRVFGEAYVPLRAHEPLLDAEKTWKTRAAGTLAAAD